MAGIYVHIPFCSQACYYCDFHFSTSLKTKNRVVNAINKELIIQKKYLQSEIINTVYFGGGTPSLLDVTLLNSIVDTINQNFTLAQFVEFTIEANPEDVEKSKVLSWQNMGFNRVSLGVQSFRDKDLKYMNRSHSAMQAIRSIEILQHSQIKNISIDLIYGHPGLGDTAWMNNLKHVIDMNIAHLSCYCLTVEPKTPLYSFIEKGKYKKLNSETGKTQFLLTRNMLIKNNYHHYEISNFSKSGFQSLHNQNYWNKTKYLGVGPSAHSFNGQTRQWNIKNNITYCQSIEQERCFYEQEKLTRKNLINEYILTSLRTSKGASAHYLGLYMKKNEKEVFNREIDKLKCKKLIMINNHQIVLTETGMLFADSISENLFLI
tara:strand:+ start:2454 stop:3581 length:1128 start_codon:yes stop_codon:yes gene_type:complete